MYQVPVRCNVDDIFYSVMLIGVRNNAESSAIVLYSAWTSVDKAHSSLYVYSKFFPQVTTRKSVRGGHLILQSGLARPARSSYVGHSVDKKHAQVRLQGAEDVHRRRRAQAGSPVHEVDPQVAVGFHRRVIRRRIQQHQLGHNVIKGALAKPNK